MKRKKIKLLSSILGISAICGLFGLSLLGSNETKEISAANHIIEEGVSELEGFSYFDSTSGKVLRYQNNNSLFRYQYYYDDTGGEFTYHLSTHFGYFYLNIGDTLITASTNDNYSGGFVFDNEINRSELYIDSVTYSYSTLASYESAAFIFTCHFKYGMYENGAYTWSETSSSFVSFGSVLAEVMPVGSSGYGPDSFDEVYAPTESILINVTTYSSMIYDYQTGYEDGYSIGFTEGNNVGYNNGYSTGYDTGNAFGYTQGVDSQQQAIINAYNEGYNVGYSEGYNSDSTVASIFSGILQVGLLPVNFFLSIFNFEILGINIASFVSALLTIAITVVVIRIIMGSKNG